MTELKWIKVAINVFDNRKIKQLECMPKGDAYIVMWFKLLCLAGGCNDGGLVYLTKNIPYTTEMLATQLNKPVAFVKTALEMFQAFGMIEVNNNYIQLTGWEKYQSTDKMAEIREQTRQRVARHREKTKCNVTDDSDCNEDDCVTGNVAKDDDVTKCNVTERYKVTHSNATDKEVRSKNKNIDKDIEKEKDISNDISKKKTTRHTYGSYKNVLLSDEEMAILQKEFPFEWEERIERLSEYMASTGKSYKNHLATIRAWARKEQTTPKKGNVQDLREVSEEVQAMLDRGEFW